MPTLASTPVTIPEIVAAMAEQQVDISDVAVRRWCRLAAKRNVPGVEQGTDRVWRLEPEGQVFKRVFLNKPGHGLTAVDPLALLAGVLAARERCAKPPTRFAPTEPAPQFEPPGPKPPLDYESMQIVKVMEGRRWILFEGNEWLFDHHPVGQADPPPRPEGYPPLPYFPNQAVAEEYSGLKFAKILARYEREQAEKARRRGPTGTEGSTADREVGGADPQDGSQPSGQAAGKVR